MYLEKLIMQQVKKAIKIFDWESCDAEFKNEQYVTWYQMEARRVFWSFHLFVCTYVTIMTIENIKFDLKKSSRLVAASRITYAIYDIFTSFSRSTGKKIRSKFRLTDLVELRIVLESEIDSNSFWSLRARFCQRYFEVLFFEIFYEKWRRWESWSF